MTKYTSSHNISSQSDSSTGSTFTDGINSFFDAMLATGWEYKKGISRYVKSSPAANEHLLAMPQGFSAADKYEFTPETVFFHPVMGVSISIRVSITNANYGSAANTNTNIAQFIFRVGTGYDDITSTMTGTGVIEETKRYFSVPKDFNLKAGVTTQAAVLPLRAYQSASAAWVQSENFVTSVISPRNPSGLSLAAFAFLKSRTSDNILFITTPRHTGEIFVSGDNADFSSPIMSFDYPSIVDAWLIVRNGGSSSVMQLGARGIGQLYEANNHGGAVGSAFFGNVFTTVSGELDVFDAYIGRNSLGVAGDTALIDDPVSPISKICISTPFFGNTSITLPSSPVGVGTSLWLPWE